MKVTSLFKFFLKSIPPESEILDLGCGTGIPFGKYTADRGFKLTGIDFSEEMITMAEQNVPQGTFKVQSMEKLKGYEKYDAIFASYSLQLLSPSSFLKVTELCSKILKHDGLFYLSLNESKTKHGDYAVFMGERMFFRDYSEEELTSVFNRNRLIKLAVDRSIEDSETFGREYMLEMIFRKK